MSDALKCMICNKCESCKADMHSHQVTCHSIEQLSLALVSLIELKSDHDTAKNNKSKRRKAKAATNSPLQRELDNCVSAIDKVLPPTAKVEGRRKKNPRPRRNNNGAGTRNHSLSKEITETADKMKNITTDDIKPIQQPQLSSTINIPVKRSLRKKATKCNDAIEEVKEKTTSRKTPVSSSNKRETGVRKNVRRKHASASKPCSSVLEKILASKSTRRKKQINVVDTTKLSYVLADSNNQKQVNWNKAYQTYIEGLQTMQELPTPFVQTDYQTSNVELAMILNNNNNTDSLNMCNQPMNSLENPYQIQDEMLNKTLIESSDLINDLKSIVPEHLGNMNEDSNPESLSINLSNDVKDFIVEFFEEEENMKSTNPYWEDNMNKYFPSETESSSEIEQFNDNIENYIIHNNNEPLNLVVVKDDNFSQIHQDIFNNNPTQVGNKAICKSTWSAEYMNSYNENIRSSYDANTNSFELSYRYKYTCPTCSSQFLNYFAFEAHISSCRGLNDKLEKKSDEKIIEEHFYKKFVEADSNMLVDSINQAISNNINSAPAKYQCNVCQIGFANRTNYCKHMLNHKKNN